MVFFIGRYCRAELFKQWLAKVGYERIQEIGDPEQSIERAREGLTENAKAGKKGGKIAKDARLALENKTGKKVVPGENFLPPAKENKKLNKI